MGCCCRRKLLSPLYPPSCPHTDTQSQTIRTADVLPLKDDARGNTTAIRAKAQAFNVSPPVLARTIGHTMIWAVVGLANQASHLRTQGYETPALRDVIQSCRDTAQDVMVFAGLIRYKLPGRVWEMLAQAGQEMGV